MNGVSPGHPQAASLEHGPGARRYQPTDSRVHAIRAAAATRDARMLPLADPDRIA